MSAAWLANVSTTKAISDAIQKGMPLIERVVTMTGERLKNPGNYIVKIGTSTKELIDYCGGITGDDVTIKAGGPMMGFDLSDPDVPIMKGSNGIIAGGYRPYGRAALYQMRTLRGCLSHGTFSAVFLEICG